MPLIQKGIFVRDPLIRTRVDFFFSVIMKKELFSFEIYNLKNVQNKIFTLIFESNEFALF